METKTKRKYVAPAVLEDLRLEMEAQILQSSSKEPEIDPNFEKVETMGQEIGGTIGSSTDWAHEW